MLTKRCSLVLSIYMIMSFFSCYYLCFLYFFSDLKTMTERLKTDTTFTRNFSLQRWYGVLQTVHHKRNPTQSIVSRPTLWRNSSFANWGTQDSWRIESWRKHQSHCSCFSYNSHKFILVIYSCHWNSNCNFF